MTPNSELIALAAKCEVASGAMYALDEEIARAIGWPENVVPKPYTASLDAAMTLAPDGWFLRVEPRFYSDDGDVRWRAYAIKPDWSRWTPHDDWFEVVGEEYTITAAKAAFALTAAALRARIRSEAQ